MAANGGYADNSTEVSEQITSQMSSIERIPNRKFSFVSWEKNVTSFLGERYYCTRTQSPLDIRFAIHHSNVGQ